MCLYFITFSGVRFDLGPTDSSHAHATGSVNVRPEAISYDNEISLASAPSRDWEIDVRGMVSTKKWLQIYGLKKNRLDMFHILPQIGFRHSEGL